MADLLTPDPKRLVAIDRLELPPTIPTVAQSSGYSAALSPDQQTTSDVIAQVYRGTSVVRHSPLPVQASAAAGAAANSAAKVIVEQSQSNVTTYVPGQNVTFTPNASGGATAINAVVPSAGGSFLPIPNSGVFFLSRATVGTSSLQTLGDTSTAAQSGGAASLISGLNPTATSGVLTEVTLGNGAIDGFLGWFPINQANFWSVRNCKYQARVGVGASAAGTVCCFGFTTTTPSSMRVIPGGGSVIIFTPGVGISDNWHATVDGGATSVDMGVPIGTGAAVMEIIMNDAANTSSFSVNGSTPTVITGSNPAGIAWWPTATFAQTGIAAITYGVQYFYGQQDF